MSAYELLIEGVVSKLKATERGNKVSCNSDKAGGRVISFRHSC